MTNLSQFSRCSVEIRTENLSNTNLEWYRYTVLLGRMHGAIPPLPLLIHEMIIKRGNKLIFLLQFENISYFIITLTLVWST
jgi:hypothetical protein